MKITIDKVEQLLIYEHDDIPNVVEAFCNIHSKDTQSISKCNPYIELSKTKKDKLLAIIVEQAQDIKQTKQYR